MCQIYHIVAYGNCPDRHIARCEHGALHLAWDYATYHLSQDGLERLLELVLTFMAEARAMQASAETVPIFQVWFNRSGLCLTGEELNEMHALVQRAVDGMAAGTAPQPVASQAAYGPHPAAPVMPNLN